jgi:hypothetical protein
MLVNKLKVLKEYIKKNLKTKFIKKFILSIKILILFILKKDRKL